jgi:hypothetical protein
MTKFRISVRAYAALACLSFALPANAQWYEGPSGGTGGSKFDFWTESGGAQQIGSLEIWYDSYYKNEIYCLKVNYRGTPNAPDYPKTFLAGKCNKEPNPEEVWNNRYKMQLINLKGDEYIVGIEGWYGDYITKLRVYTSKNTLDWVGSGGKYHFAFTAPPGLRIVSFFGRRGDAIDSLGVLFARNN